MRKVNTALLATAAIYAAMLFVIPISSVPADAAMVFYEEDKDIRVEFPYGQESAGGRLTVDLYSEVYDMERSGIMFYELGDDGKYNAISSVKLENQKVLEGKVVRRVFINFKQDVEMHFCDLVLLDPQVGNADGDDPRATFILAALLVISTLMLVFIRWIIWKTDILLKELEAAA